MGAARRVAMTGLATSLAFSAPVAGAAGFTFTSQARSVAVTITQRTLSCLPPPSGCSQISSTSQSDSETAPDFSAFSATAMVPPFTQSSATQNSTLAARSIHASGTLAAASSGGLVTPPNIFGTSESSLTNSFSTQFDVAEATPYRLNGSVESNGGLSANTTTRVTLKTAGGALIAEVVAATDPGCSDTPCSQVGPLPVASYGTLAPGSYVLEAVSTGSAAPFFFAGNIFGLASSGSYSVTLADVTAPALSRSGMAALVGCLALVSLATIRRARRVRG